VHFTAVSTEHDLSPGSPQHAWLSAELAAVCSKLGRIPTVAEYMEAVGVLNKDSENIYKYLNFDQIEEYVENAKETAV
jgi:aconitate hydratase 2/2-methylisocitrate dehydratase